MTAKRHVIRHGEFVIGGSVNRTVEQARRLPSIEWQAGALALQIFLIGSPSRDLTALSSQT